MNDPYLELTLFDTIVPMTSQDYKNRFVAEYIQVFIRLTKLDNMIHSYRMNLLDFEPSCPIELLEKQSDSMRSYLEILRQRSKIENINLDEEINKLSNLIKANNKENK